MSSCSEQMIWNCVAEARQRYADRAERLVEQQIGWSRGRSAQDEVQFWTRVLERLVETRPPLAVSRTPRSRTAQPQIEIAKGEPI